MFIFTVQLRLNICFCRRIHICSINHLVCVCEQIWNRMGELFEKLRSSGCLDAALSLCGWYTPPPRTFPQLDYWGLCLTISVTDDPTFTPTSRSNWPAWTSSSSLLILYTTSSLYTCKTVTTFQETLYENGRVIPVLIQHHVSPPLYDGQLLNLNVAQNNCKHLWSD